jgi:hypothetical protein
MITIPDYFFTKNGARLPCVFGKKANKHSNWLLVPAPGLSSDCLMELATLLQNQVKGAVWMLDYPNDGNIDKSGWTFPLV